MRIPHGIFDQSRRFVAQGGGGSFVDASGGTITYDGDYKIHTFTSSGTLIVTTGGDVSTLLQGVGGSGGSYFPETGYRHAGGGGASGIVLETTTTLTPGNKDVSIGAFPGGTVYFNGLSAAGGGNGTSGNYTTTGKGGSNSSYSGGGSSIYYVNSGGGGAGSRGNGNSSPPYAHAGRGGEGGAGYTSSISGSSVVYGQGGHGGTATNEYNATNGSPGPAGVVIIRYKYK